MKSIFHPSAAIRGAAACLLAMAAMPGGAQTTGAPAPTGGQTANTGSISGVVTGDDGKTLAAVVTANGVIPLAASGHAKSASSGAFTISGLAAGTYQLCVNVTGGGYLDPCVWEPVLPTVQVTAAQAVSGYVLTVKKGALLQVRVNDPGGVLPVVGPPPSAATQSTATQSTAIQSTATQSTATQSAATRSATVQTTTGQAPSSPSPSPAATGHLLVGIFTTRSIFQPLAISATDSGGTTRQATVPVSSPFSLSVSGQGVQITNSTGAALNPAGTTIQQPNGAPSSTIVLNVSAAAQP
jgi:hypothetical protein